MHHLRTMATWAALGAVCCGCGEAPTPAPVAAPASTPRRATPPAPPVVKKSEPPVDPRAFASPAAALDALLAAIKSNDARGVITAEGWFGTQGEPAAVALHAVVRDEMADLERRLTACRALGSMGATGGQKLLECLPIEPEQLQLRVIESVSRVKPPTAVIIGRLHTLALDGDVRMRHAALKGLGRIGPPAKEVVPDLQKILNDPSADEQLRGEAGKALKAIDPRKGLMGVAK